MQMLLVEDDATIARELALRWQQRGWSLQRAASLGAARTAMAVPGLFDLVLLDLGLPDGDGMAFLAELRRGDARLPVLVLTARDLIADRVQGLRQGADDYLIKPFAIDELDARVESLLRRAGATQGQRASFGELCWLGDEGRACLGEESLELSPREFEVLGLLVHRAPRLLPKRALIDALAERNLEINDSAAEVYISRLRRRLAGSNVGIRTLRGFGYQLVVKATPRGSEDTGRASHEPPSSA
jgi:DNA-binding response OmpR family regulator